MFIFGLCWNLTHTTFNSSWECRHGYSESCKTISRGKIHLWTKPLWISDYPSLRTAMQAYRSQSMSQKYSHSIGKTWTAPANSSMERNTVKVRYPRARHLAYLLIWRLFCYHCLPCQGRTTSCSWRCWSLPQAAREFTPCSSLLQSFSSRMHWLA